MTWRDLLGGTRKPPPAATAPAPTTTVEKPQEPEPASSPSCVTDKVPQASPSQPTKPSGFFELPPSPRSLTRPRDEIAHKAQEPSPDLSESSIANAAPTTPEPAPASPPKVDQNSPEARWEPPSNGCLPPRTPTTPSGSSTWFIDESSVPNHLPIATSPVKASFRTELSSEPSSVDRRKARLLFSQDFIEGIEQLEEERKKVDSFQGFDDSDLHGSQSNNIHVFVRKRPLENYIENTNHGDFDVVRVIFEEESSSPCVVVYNTQIQHDLRKLEVKPAIFGPFSACFNEQCDSGEVYERSAKSLVETAKSGGVATLLMFGQKQSGKSYTMSAVEGMTARDIFTGLPYNHTVKVTVIELCGKRCIDLMDDSPSAVRITDDNNNNSLRFVNALSVAVSTPEDLLAAIVTAKTRRQSDVSHIVCRITILPPPDAPSCIRTGTLYLMDCAGSERQREDRNKNNNRKASYDVEIQAGLRALKECLRAKTSSTSRSTNSLPYSSSNLTRCLRESLEREDATFHVIATISPKATDTEDTLDTLSTLSNLVGGFAEELSKETVGLSAASTDSHSNAEIPLPPKGWDRSKLCDWLIRKHLVQDRTSLPTDITGRVVMKMTKKELQKTFYDKDDQKADLLYRCLRAETDRVARLEVKRRMAIERSRKSN